MSLEAAILGFLNFSPMTGYDLKKQFDASVAHFWSATQSHIYKALDRLEADGLVTVEAIPQEDRPTRKVYRITQEGTADLLRRLAEPEPLEHIRMGWLIQVFFAAYLPEAKAFEMVRARIEALRKQLDYYKGDVRPDIDQGAAYVGDEKISRWWHLTLDTGIAYRQAELELLESFLKEEER